MISITLRRINFILKVKCIDKFFKLNFRLLLLDFKFFFCSIVFNSDTEECLSDQHNCHPNADCISTQGSFICSCKDGFLGDGRECVGKLKF